jgi:Leucine-rich repeat (LRR) protein
MSYNRLTSLLSLDFELFPHLTTLDLSNNQIRDLGNVHRARALRSLLLENNDLRYIPPELALLEQVGQQQLIVSQAVSQSLDD